jgi:hypothetical protein
MPRWMRWQGTLTEPCRPWGATVGTILLLSGAAASVVSAGVTLVVGLAATAVAVATWSGRRAAYLLVLAAAVLIVPCAWWWGGGGDVGRDCPVLEWTDGCAAYWDLQHWYGEQWMPALAILQVAAWLTGTVVLLLTVPLKFWSARTWGLDPEGSSSIDVWD